MWRTTAIALFLTSLAWPQDADRVVPATEATPPQSAKENKRIFWVIPNSRTSPTMKEFRPITAKEKFKIANDDALDPGTFVLAGIFAGKSQFTNADPSLGQGMAGYARRFGTSFGDFAIADYMTEGVFPAMLRHDPRYFRRATGSGWSRLGYAVGQIFVTHADSGRTAFNFSEIGGNAAAVAISNAYYVDDRTPGAAAGKLCVQVGLDMMSNIMKEFWPDIQQKLQRKHR